MGHQTFNKNFFRRWQKSARTFMSRGESISIGKFGIKKMIRPEENIKIITLNYIYVKPEFRNHGYGKIALKELEKQFPSYLMMLNVDDNGRGNYSNIIKSRDILLYIKKMKKDKDKDKDKDKLKKM